MNILKIGPYNYSINYVDEVSSSEHLCSKSSYGDLVIRISNKVCDNKQMRTIYVQMVFTALDLINYKMKQRDVENIANGIHMVLTDNYLPVKEDDPLPDTIKIGSSIYEIITDEKLLEQENVYGLINHEKNTITLSLAKKRQTTLIHEILHGIIDFFQIEFDDEEDFVTRFAPVLHMILLDNKWLLPNNKTN